MFGKLYKRVSKQMRYHQIFTNFAVHERLLSDASRLDAYQLAIARYVRPGDTVVDVGTGTGVLSFLAAAQRPKKVYAIDHSDIIEQARQVAAHNGLSSIEFVKTASASFDPAEKVDVIIQEQIGTHVFDENMVATIVDLRDRILKPGGRILPNRFQVYIEPVQVKDEYRIPLLWEQRVAGVSYACLQPWYERELRSELAVGYVRPHQIDHLLCDPTPLVEFDLMTIGAADLPRSLGGDRTVVHDSRLDGFCMYFRALFDDEIVLSNDPWSAQTNWAMPLLRAPARAVTRGETIGFKLSMGDPTLAETWRWSYDGSEPLSRPAPTAARET